MIAAMGKMPFAKIDGLWERRRGLEGSMARYLSYIGTVEFRGRARPLSGITFCRPWFRQKAVSGAGRRGGDHSCQGWRGWKLGKLGGLRS